MVLHCMWSLGSIRLEMVGCLWLRNCERWEVKGSRLIFRNCSGVRLEQGQRAYGMCAHSDVHNEFAWDVSIY
jgi:hypothetical protein